MRWPAARSAATQARNLVEATSSGALGKAVAAMPPEAQDVVRNAAEQGFLHGLNEILILGAILSVGSVLALGPVREREIERETVTDRRLELATEGANA